MSNKLLLCLFAAVLAFITACGDSEVMTEVDSGTVGEAQQTAKGNQPSAVKESSSKRAVASKNIKPAPLVKLPIPSATEKLAPQLTMDDVVQRANTLESLFQRLRDSLDRSQFDLIALNRSLEFDGEALVDYVTNAIAFEQYVGVLRGAKGTLLGRAGNALDQSVLLNSLLEDAGYESRIARGSLTTEQASKLINQMAHTGATFSEVGDEVGVQKILDEIIDIQGGAVGQIEQLDSNPNENFYQTSTESDTHFILDALEQAGLTLGDSDAMVKLVEEAREYYWVEYRLNAFDPWETAHPAFNSAPELVAEQTFIKPPQELFHRVRFETFIEQKAGDKLLVNPLVSNWESTTAELVGNPFTYKNHPNNLDLETVGDLPSLLGNTSIFYPLVNGEMAGNGFDLDGQSYKLDLLAMDKMGATQLSQTTSKQLGKAIETLGGLDKPAEEKAKHESMPTLTAQWMEYTVIAPNSGEKTYRRYVLDRVGVDNRKKGIAEVIEQTDLEQLAQSLLTDYTIMVLPSRYPKAYTLDRFAARSLQEIALLKEYVKNPSVEAVSKLNTGKLKPVQDAILDAAFKSGFELSSDILTYRKEATIVVYEQGLIPSENAEMLFERVDIVHNERRTLSMANKVKIDQVAAVRAGVWETHVERAPLRKIGVEFNTTEGFRKSSEQNIPLRVLTSDDIEFVDVLNHSELTKNNLKEVLAQGYAVIVPSESISPLSDTVWWRVDLSTGNALGMATGGYGVAATTYAIQTVSFLMGAYSMYACMNNTGNTTCCFLAGLTLMVIGRFFAAYDSAIAFLFGIGNSAPVLGTGGRICRG